MSEDWLGLGPLEIVETYVYYDRPLLFLAESHVHGRLLVVLVDDQESRERWLSVPLSMSRLRALKAHRLTLHDAFADPEAGWVFECTVDYEADPIVHLVRNLSVRDLPSPGIFLTDIPEYVDTLEMHLEGARPEDHTIEPRVLGAFIQKASNLFNEVVLARPREAARTLFRASAVVPGSFGIVFESAFSGLYAEHTEQYRAFLKVMELMDGKGFDSVLPRARRSFSHLLKVLSDNSYGVNMEWQPHQGAAERYAYTAFHIQEVLARLTETSREEGELLTYRGHFEGSNVPRKTFRFRTSDNQTIFGVLSPPVYDIPITTTVETESAPLAEIEVRQIVQLNAVTYEENVSNVLESLVYIRE